MGSTFRYVTFPFSSLGERAPGPLSLSLSLSSSFHVSLKCFLGFTDTFQSTLLSSLSLSLALSEMLPRIHRYVPEQQSGVGVLSLSFLQLFYSRVLIRRVRSMRGRVYTSFGSLSLPRRGLPLPSSGVLFLSLFLLPSLPAASVFFPV